MTTRRVFVAAVWVLLFAPAAAVGCSSPHHAAGNASTGVSGSSSVQPKNRLIVLGRSIGGISLGESRTSVEKAFVIYWFHDQLTKRVEALVTRWGGFSTRSGVRIGTSRQGLRALRVACRGGECNLAAGRLPDAPGTIFTMRHGKVAQIDILYG
jgi:hypothetical protein